MEPNQECSYAYLNKVCVSADIFDNKLLFGTAADGLFYLDWTATKAVGCDIENPTDITGSIETFSDFSGLLSNNILKIEANNGFLGVLTDSGFSYGKHGEPAYINYITESGKDCFVCKADFVYVAEGNRIVAKATPTDFTAWDTEYNLDQEVNDIWVVEKDGINTLFVATQSGVVVFEKDASFSYGSRNYSQIKAEVGTTINQGHIFAVSSNTVDIINMRTKLLDDTITYDGTAILGIENKRLYSK